MSWSKQFSTFCFLDNNQYNIAPPHTQECLLAGGVKDAVPVTPGRSLEQFEKWQSAKTDRWIFGHLGYDLKNELEPLTSANPDRIGFPDLYFFEPLIIVRFNAQEIIVEAENADKVFNEIINTEIESSGTTATVSIQHRIPREEYLSIIEKLRQHILRGDCYEINFCQEFFAEHAAIDPIEVYKELAQVSPNPFSALYRVDKSWLICASPERFIQKQNDRILSQPIKGTAKRFASDEVLDDARKQELYLSAKDRSENVMIVDLVRNDLSKICKEGTVKVDELYGVYAFPQVFQMISTISGELKDEISLTEILRACFPMGSMTGAPKKRVMQLIEQYEKTRRGIFSGAIGYIDPAGNFDFNVVIRSILYNESDQYLCYLVGSGITFYSDPAQEWEECNWKAEAIQRVLDNKR